MVDCRLERDESRLSVAAGELTVDDFLTEGKRIKIGVSE